MAHNALMVDRPAKSIGPLASIVEASLRLYSRVTPTGRGTYRLVRSARQLISKPDWCREFKTPHGVLMDLDLAIYPDCAMAFGFFELETARLLRRLLRPGDHMIDGGANIGYFTLMAAQAVGPSGRIDAFEPNPGNRARLLANIQRNDFTDRVHVHPEALSDQPGQMMIHTYTDSGHNHGTSSLFPEVGAKTVASPVVTTRMDQAIINASPRLIKLDLEGAEPLAITGMTGLLKSQQPPLIVTEYSPACAQTAGFKPRELVDRILAIQPKYALFRIGRSLQRIEPTDEALDALKATGGEVNLLFDSQPGSWRPNNKSV